MAARVGMKGLGMDQGVEVSVPVVSARRGGADAHPIKVVNRNVNLWYGEKQALYDVSVDIPERAVTAFIGPSGCGKSTFLRCINRMNDTIPIARLTGRTFTIAPSTSSNSEPGSAWCSRSRTRSRNRSTKMSPTGRASTAWLD